MKLLARNVLLVGAVVVLGTALQSSTASAQTVSFGADGNLRILWKGADGTAQLWLIDANLNPGNAVAYSNPGYLPAGISTGQDNLTRILWKGTDGSAQIWRLDQNLVFLDGASFGPFFGWIPETVYTNAFSNTYLTWAGWDGQASVWLLDPALQVVVTMPYSNPGFSPNSAVKNPAAKSEQMSPQVLSPRVPMAPGSAGQEPTSPK